MPVEFSGRKKENQLELQISRPKYERCCGIMVEWLPFHGCNCTFFPIGESQETTTAEATTSQATRQTTPAMTTTTTGRKTSFRISIQQEFKACT